MNAKVNARHLREKLVKSLSLRESYTRDFTGTYYGRKIDMSKILDDQTLAAQAAAEAADNARETTTAVAPALVPAISGRR